jgi:serine/threonine-protein kinase
MTPAGPRDEFLDRPAAELAAPYLRALDAEGSAPTDARIGPWRILGEAGRGGMGTVYRAVRDDDQYHQQVALKLVRGWLAFDAHHLRRFRAERQILAALEHPGIARLLDGGVTDDGVPWFAMEYVDGLPIDEHARARGLTIPARLRLFLDACLALEYAHQHLVVHRDVKPANLLVTGTGQVKLLDFGVARMLGSSPDGESAALQTAAGLMTPAFASPEQLRGEPIAVASDVYSLGVVLYLLLTGSLPHRRQGGSPHELVRAVLEDDPPLASTIAPLPDRRALRGDLDTILEVALRKEPSRRYRSVETLAEDIRRHLDGRPITARAGSRHYRAGRFVQRHRIEVLAAALITAALVGGLLVARSQAASANRQRVVAEREAARARDVATFLARLFRLADPNVALGDTVTMGTVLDSAAVWLEREHIEDPETRAEIALVRGDLYGTLGRSDAHRRMVDTALAIQERLYGREDPRLGLTLTTIAEAMRGQGRLRDAESLLRRTVELLPDRTGRASRDRDHALNKLALSLRDQGQLAAADSVLREALAISRRNAADHPLGLHRSLTNLGHVALASGDAPRAEVLHREVLTLRRDYWGPRHPEVANALINVATAVGRQDRFAEAERLFLEGLAMRRELQGAAHTEVGVDLAALAALYHQHGDRDAARARYAEAVRIQEVTLRADHPLLRAARESLAVLSKP